MNRDELRNLIENLAEAWRRRDYAAAAHTFTEDVRYADPLRYSFQSRDDLRAFFEDDGGYPQRVVFRTILFDEEQQTGAAEYTYEGTHRYHGVVLLRVRDGKISHWREYQHIDPREWEEFASGTAF